MPVRPIERHVEALLTDAVFILYGAFRANDFPENYVRSLALGKMHEHLHEFRNLAHPAYRDRTNPASSASLSEPTVPSEEEAYRRALSTADSRLRDAVKALWEADAALAEEYVNTSAQNFMAVCLHGLRTQETPAERAALVSEVNRLRASVGLGPMTWGQVTSVLS